MITLLIACAFTTSTIDPELEQILKVHESNLSGINSINGDIAVRASEDGGSTWLDVLAYTVSRSGSQEAYTIKGIHGFSSGKFIESNTFKRYVTLPEGRKILVYNGIKPEEVPSEPIDITELESSGRKITGEIDAPEPFGPHGYKSIWLAPVLMLIDQRFTLRELCSASNPTPVQVKAPNGDDAIRLDLQTPTKDRKYQVLLDPKHNYLIVQRKVLTEQNMPIDYFGSMTVNEIQEPKPGIFLPKTIKGTSPVDPKRLYEVSFANVVVNEPIDDGTFQFRFPAGIIVFDPSHDNCYHLWGDGKPEFTFKTPAEVNNWKIAQMASFLKRARNSNWTEKLIWVIVATIVLIAVLAARRLALRKSEA